MQHPTTRREFLASSAAAAALPLTRHLAPVLPRAPLKILILGGTGYLGPETVEVALAHKHEVTLFNRGRTNPQLFPDVEKLHGDRDPKKGDGLKALEGTRKWDVVIDNSGYVPRIVGASAELLKERAQHYVFVSTCSVYEDVPGKILDESAKLMTAPDPTTEEVRRHYGALKALCEAAAEKAFPGRTSNVRPGLIVGPGDPTDRYTYWPVRVARGGEVLCPGKAEAKVQFVDVRDLAEFLVRVIEEKVYGVFNAVSDPSFATFGKMVESCKRASGSDATFTWVDEAWLLEKKVRPWSELPLWIPSKDACWFSPAAAVAKGLRFRGLEDTAKATLAWFEKARKDKPMTAPLAAAKEKELLAAWHERAKATPATGEKKG